MASRNFSNIFSGMNILRRHNPIALIVGDETIKVQIGDNLGEAKAATLASFGWEQEAPDTYVYEKGGTEA